VPPAPPSLPKRSKSLEPITPNASSLEDIEDPGATNLSYKLPGFAAKNPAQPQSSNDVVDNFYETQAMGNVLNPNPNTGSKATPNLDLRTVEMNSLTGTDEDLKSTSVGMPIANYVADNTSKSVNNKSEEYFPTVLTQPKPPESPEEQLKLLKELMEAGGESWKVPPPAPPPPSQSEGWKNPAPSAPSTEQTLSMAALPRSIEANNQLDNKVAMAAENVNKPFEQTITGASPSKQHPQTQFDQTLNSTPAFSLQKDQKTPKAPSIEELPLSPIPQTLTMKAAPKGKAEDFSYPNLEGPSSSEEIMPETVQMQKPPEGKDISAALNSWSSDVTNPWGSPVPSLSPAPNPDAKTESLSNKAFSAPQQEKPKSKKDAFKTISVGPRLQKPNQASKDTPSAPLSMPSSASDFADDDPNKTTISTFGDMIQQEKPLANTAPISLSQNQPEDLPQTVISAPAINPQTVIPSIPTPIVPPETQTPPAQKKKASFKIPLLIGIIIALLLSIVLIAWKLVESISSGSKTNIASPTPVVSVSPTPVASASPTPVASASPTPDPVTITPPENMVLIPEGEYKVGSDSPGPDGDTFSSPQRTVKISAFFMDIYEVTNEEYSKFIQAEARPAPKNWQNGQYPGKAQDPVSNVSWEDAQAYAKWAGKRLPTEEEWEIAASGQDHFLYPWGNDPDTKRANSKEFGAKSVRTVGSVKTSKSSFGLYDMSGNVWEWTSSPAKAYPNAKEPKTTDPAQQRIFRGGSYQDKIEYCSTTFRGYEAITLTSPILGFRCAKDVSQK
jgi:formylglycine-generating enzyme required for sulfatase activity